MKVTVIMGVYNPPVKEQLDYAINSIINQTLTDFEFLIVDDGSDDITKKWLADYEIKDSRIRIITNSENKGLASSLNLCLTMAQGDYIARMDADDYSYPNRLNIQYSFLKEHEEYSFVGCNAELIQEYSVWGVRKMPEQPSEVDFLPYSPFIHPSVMVRKEVFNICGGYQEGKETWRSEDYEIFMRMYALGFKGYNLQKNLFKYREDKVGYQKRKYRYRIDEAKIRKRYFKDLAVNPILKALYILKPLFVGLFPTNMIQFVKQIKGRKEMYETQKLKPTPGIVGSTKISSNIAAKPVLEEFSYAEQRKA